MLITIFLIGFILCVFFFRKSKKSRFAIKPAILFVFSIIFSAQNKLYDEEFHYLLIDDIYQKCHEQTAKPKMNQPN